MNGCRNAAAEGPSIADCIRFSSPIDCRVRLHLLPACLEEGCRQPASWLLILASVSFRGFDALNWRGRVKHAFYGGRVIALCSNRELAASVRATHRRYSMYTYCPESPWSNCLLTTANASCVAMMLPEFVCHMRRKRLVKTPAPAHRRAYLKTCLLPEPTHSKLGMQLLDSWKGHICVVNVFRHSMSLAKMTWVASCMASNCACQPVCPLL